MIINTHIVFSRYIFSHCLKKLNFKLCKPMFMYGNIKPDLFPGTSDSSHTFKNNIGTVKDYSDMLLNNKLDVKEFSLVLGVLCHYICDFFCIYHNENRNKSLIAHIKYEVKLHFKLIWLLSRGKFNPSLNGIPPEKDILSIIAGMQKKYSNEIESDIKDITYAISAGMHIAESIIYYSSQAPEMVLKPAC